MKFGIFVDASKFGLGAQLYQYDDSNEEEKFTVAYASRSLKGAELNYTVTEIECLALVWALRKWHTTLLGRHVKIHSDHKALKFLTACADDSARIARWMAFLGEFNLEICHIPGKENTIADTLSRNNVKNGYAKKEEKIKHIAAVSQPNDENESTKWVELIAEAQQTDEQLNREIGVASDITIREHLVRILLEDGERVVVPEAVKWNLVKRVHAYLLHFGTDKVTDFLKQYFMLNNLERVVRDVVASCDVCQSTKYYTRPTRGVEYYDLPERPGQTVSVDIFGPLPQTPRGNKYILVAMDQFSKLTKLYPIKNQKLESIMDCLQLGYFSQIGIPIEILTDNGGQFITGRWQEFATDMGFSIRKTSPYNPQSNPVERVMRELGRIIRAYAHDRQTRWDTIIGRTENTINSTTHRSTGYRPIDLHENMEETLKIDPRLKPIEELEEDTEEKIIAAKETLRRRAQQRKVQTDKHGEAKEYEPGQRVWVKLHRRSDANRRLTRKIHLVYDGPYIIQQEVRKNAYLIRDDQGNVLGTYNSRQIKPNREAKLEPQAEINMMEVEGNISSISKQRIKEFVVKMTKSHNEQNNELEINKSSLENSKDNQKLGGSEKQTTSSMSSKKDVEKKPKTKYEFKGNKIIEEILEIENKRRKTSREETGETRRSSKEATTREESESRQGNPIAGENLKNKKKYINDGKEELQSLTWDKPIRTSTPIDPATSGDEDSDTILKTKKSKISEKGMRHIKRLIDLISGRKNLPFLVGKVEQIRTKIIMDTRGEFNVITCAAVKEIEKRVRKLVRSKDSENIPAYLKREKRVTFKTVTVETELFNRTIKVEAMILDGDERCLVLGRKARKKLGRKIRESPKEDFQLTRSSEHLSLQTLERLRKEEEVARKSAKDMYNDNMSKVQQSANNSKDKVQPKVHESVEVSLSDEQAKEQKKELTKLSDIVVCEDSVCCERSFSRGRIGTDPRDIRTGQQLEDQVGRLKRQRVTAADTVSEESSISNDEMLSKEEAEAMDQRENELVQRIANKIKIDAIRRRREERIQMLERLLSEEAEELKNISTEQISELIVRENERSREISKSIYDALNAENLQKTFFERNTLRDDEGKPAHEVTTIVTIRNVDVIGAKAKPIYLNMTFDGNQVWGDIGYVNNQQLTQSAEEPSKVQHLENNNNNSKVTNKEKAKPRIIADVKIRSPDTNKQQIPMSQTIETNPNLKTDSNEDEVPLDKRMTQLDQKRVQTYKRKRTSDDSDHSGHSEKELRRPSKSRQSPLAGAMKPVASPSVPAAKSPDINRSVRVQLEEVPVAGTSGTNPSTWGGDDRPRKYRAVSREAGTGPGGEPIYRNFLEEVQGAESSDDEEAPTPTRT
ncbi:retrovirus-related pol polyprotein from transposon [Lasius niger]|uniref:RNA-directed DNA polymerase n=1 Tax=Lasius niger TaxID=67767 RepID=A0A0J7KDC2_LASNI|nr:retrovirus-related pol polyprotein from transposon [Lasius niger]